MARPNKADYGLDAPAVVRNLAIAGGLGLLLALAMYLGVIQKIRYDSGAN